MMAPIVTIEENHTKKNALDDSALLSSSKMEVEIPPAPDYENLLDSDKDGEYRVVVKAQSAYGGEFQTAEFLVQVNNVTNEKLKRPQ